MRVATLIARTLVALAAIAVLGGIILFVLAVHVMTWPYRSTHGGGRRRGQLEALLALFTSFAAVLAAFQARADVKAWEHNKRSRADERKRNRDVFRRWRQGHNTIGEQADAERPPDDDIPY